jgi:hypothetical protein
VSIILAHFHFRGSIEDGGEAYAKGGRMTAAPEYPLATLSAHSVALAFTAPAPIVPGEDASTYHDLRARIFAAVKPADILEELWVRDVVELVWEVVRLRRFKATLLAACAQEGMAKVLHSLGEISSFTMSTGWAARDEAAMTQVNARLAAAGLTIDVVMARTFEAKLDEMERIEGMLVRAEARRAAALRELERHRTTFAQTLRGAAQDVEDAEFKVIAEPAPQTAPEAA